MCVKSYKLSSDSVRLRKECKHEKHYLESWTLVSNDEIVFLVQHYSILIANNTYHLKADFIFFFAVHLLWDALSWKLLDEANRLDIYIIYFTCQISLRKYIYTSMFLFVSVDIFLLLVFYWHVQSSC